MRFFCRSTLSTQTVTTSPTFSTSLGWRMNLLLIWLIWAVPVGVSVFIPEVGFYLSIVWVLVGYSSLSYVTALLLRPVFRSLDENGSK